MKYIIKEEQFEHLIKEINLKRAIAGTALATGLLMNPAKSQDIKPTQDTTLTNKQYNKYVSDYEDDFKVGNQLADTTDYKVFKNALVRKGLDNENADEIVNILINKGKISKGRLTAFTKLIFDNIEINDLIRFINLTKTQTFNNMLNKYGIKDFNPLVGIIKVFGLVDNKGEINDIKFSKKMIYNVDQLKESLANGYIIKYPKNEINQDGSIIKFNNGTTSNEGIEMIKVAALREKPKTILPKKTIHDAGQSASVFFEQEIKEAFNMQNFKLIGQRVGQYLRKGFNIAAIVTSLVASGIPEAQAKEIAIQQCQLYEKEFEEVSDKAKQKLTSRLVSYGISQENATFFIEQLIKNNFDEDKLYDLINGIINNVNSKDFNLWLTTAIQHLNNNFKFYNEYIDDSSYVYNPFANLKPVDSDLEKVNLLKQNNIVSDSDDGIEKKILANWTMVTPLNNTNMDAEGYLKDGTTLTMMKLVPVYKPIKMTSKQSGQGGKGGSGCRSYLKWGDH
mgnify:CR=1 FL=1